MLLRKKIVFIIVAAMLVLNCCTAGKKAQAETILFRDNLHNGDTKFLKDRLATSVENKLCIYNLDGSYRCYDIQCNWLDVLEEDNAIVYGNFDKEIGIVFLDDDFSILEHRILWNKNDLNIDPAIIKINDLYYLTLTDISGTVNNSDPTAQNGQYTIQLYCSEDMLHWEYICDVESDYNNLEDVKLFSENDQLYVIFEKEDFDQGPSQICVKTVNVGDTISVMDSENVLLENDADHEPANFMKMEDKYVLFYSCDKDKPGQSYTGSKMYFSIYTENFECLQKDVQILADIDYGLLLFDVTMLEDKILYAVSVDYLSRGGLAVLESGYTESLNIE